MTQSVMQKLFQLLDWPGKLLAMGPTKLQFIEDYAAEKSLLALAVKKTIVGLALALSLYHNRCMRTGSWHRIVFMAGLVALSSSAAESLLPQANSWRAGQPIPREWLSYRKTAPGPAYVPASGDTTALIAGL